MSAKIHPTAVVGDAVELADDVVVGPYCVLTGKISIAAGTVLLHQVYARGPLTVGRNNRVYPNVTLGYDPQDWSFDPNVDGAGTVIGDNNIFRENVTIHRATRQTPTTIGNRNMFMACAHVAHDCQVGSYVTLANGALLAGHVTVGDGVFVGGNAGVHQYCRIGRLAMISGLHGATQDVPPFCNVLENRTITGLNRVGLRRAGLRHAIRPLEQAYNILLQSRLNNANGIQRVREEFADVPECIEFADFIATSKRGICRHYNRKDVAMLGDLPGDLTAI